MRALFLLLVLANLAFFAWSTYYAGPDTPPGPNPLERQLAADKLRVLPPSANSPPGKPAPEPAPAAQTTAPPIACLELGGFAAAEAQRAAEALAQLSLGDRLTQRVSDDGTAGWWVFMPPQGGRQGAQKKAAELKTLGVEDFFVLTDEGRQRFAISLGVFKTEAAAASRLEALRARGVRTAQIGPRESPLQKTFLQVRQVDESLAGKLAEIARGFGSAELRPCAQASG